MQLADETREGIEQLLSSRDDESSDAALARLKRSYVVCVDESCQTVPEVARIALPLLSRALLDPDPTVRVMACRGMEFFATDAEARHIEQLVAMLDDGVLEVRLEALDALGEFGPSAHAVIGRATQIVLEGAIVEERWRAVYLLQQRSLPDDSIQALLSALTSGVPSVQAAAASTLSIIFNRGADDPQGPHAELTQRVSKALSELRSRTDSQS
jgi:HEAT repeat protein